MSARWLNRLMSSFLVLIALAMGACEASPDVVAVFDENLSLTVADSGATFVDAASTSSLIVIGLPVTKWQYALAEWPLDTLLPVFFGGPMSEEGIRVRAEGDEAAVLTELRDYVWGEEFGPAGGRLGVVDLAGNTFALVFPNGGSNN